MGDKREYGYSPDYSVARGETLLETIQALGMNQRCRFNDLKRHIEWTLA